MKNISAGLARLENCPSWLIVSGKNWSRRDICPHLSVCQTGDFSTLSKCRALDYYKNFPASLG